MKRAFRVSSAILLAGCSAKYSTNNIQERTEHLVKDVSVVISQPTDGVYETHTYLGSGRASADAVKAAFLRHFANVTVFADCDDITCLKANVSSLY
ncbi:DUF4823 domain-containing protein [Enterobacter asburiae]